MKTVKCLNCGNDYHDRNGYFFEKDTLEIIKVDGEFISACRICKTDEYLTNKEGINHENS